MHDELNYSAKAKVIEELSKQMIRELGTMHLRDGDSVEFTSTINVGPTEIEGESEKKSEFEKAKQDLLEVWDNYRLYIKGYNKEDGTKTPERKIKLMFLADEVVNLTTYDDDILCQLGEEILEVMRVIYERKNFEYIGMSCENVEQYNRYIRTINYFINWLNWGTSVRGAWFDYGVTIDLLDKRIELSEEFMKWFLYEFMEGVEK